MQGKNIFHFASEIVGPDLESAVGVDQLDVDANLIAGLAHASLEAIADAEFFADVSGAFAGRFQGNDGRMGSHVDATNLRELGGDFVSHAVAEVRAVRLGAQILQWKDGDGGLGGDDCGRRGRMLLVPGDSGHGDHQSEQCQARE